MAIEFLTIVPVGRLARPDAPITMGEPSAATPSNELPAGMAGDAPTAAPAASEPPGASKAPDMSRALPWFPLVGAALGLALALVDWALAPLLALGVRDALLLALAAGCTGLLHLDGFVDCCDGLLGARSVERRLDIMRDSRVGAYGALGGALLLIARFAALGALASGSDLRALALIAAPLLGRWAMVYAVARYPYARTAGAGSPFRGPDGANTLGRRLAQATAGAVALLLASVALPALFGAIHLTSRGAQFAVGDLWRRLPTDIALVMALWGVAVIVTLAWSHWAKRRLGGGLTGDTYGALNELVELAVLVCAPPLALLLARA